VSPVQPLNSGIVPVVVRGPEPNESWVGFGSNIGDRWGIIERAVAAFGDAVVDVSPIYETEPWGIVDQPWFLNGVLRLRWTTDAAALLERCLSIEADAGRVREARNGPRTLDLDVLMVGTAQVDRPHLRVPHAGITSRRSVLEPWADAAPGLLVPGTGAPLCVLRTEAKAFEGQAVRRVEAV
jgi:2-amino-4-hydroxy-6-hydroxymethyldihydropteridine diphosphokinase